MPTPPPPKEHRFKPGDEWRGNPGGRPTGRSVSARLRDLLQKGEINGKPIKDGKQVADLLAEVILKKSLSGDYKFVDLILNRTEGKVPDRLQVEDDRDKIDTLIDELRGGFESRSGRAEGLAGEPGD